MSRKQVMYWGFNEWMKPKKPSLWERFFGISAYEAILLYYPSPGTKLRLTPDGVDLEAYYNDNGELCVNDPDTNDEVICIWA